MVRKTNKMPYKLGLTGSIATGKSTILNMFADLGHETFSADAAVHTLYQGAAVPALKAVFPQTVIDGKIDRTILAKFLIDDPQKIPVLEAIIHPLVQGVFAQKLMQLQQDNVQLFVVDVPLLFESKFNYGLDAIAVTFCDEIVQKQRAMARIGMTEDKYNAILARQMSQNKKRQLADYEIDTNLDLETTNAQVVEIASKCLEIYNSEAQNKAE